MSISADVVEVFEHPNVGVIAQNTLISFIRNKLPIPLITAILQLHFLRHPKLNKLQLTSFIHNPFI